MRIGICVFLAFVMLKVASVGVIGGWPWWVVFSPVWIPVLAAVVLMCLAIIVKIFIGLYVRDKQNI